MATENPKIEFAKKPDEISVGGLVIKLKEYVRAVIRFWYLVILGAIPFCAKDYLKISKVKPSYPAKLTLLVKPQEIAKENKTLVLIFSKIASSRRLMEEILLEPIGDDLEDNLLINVYLETYSKNKPEGLPPTIPPGFQFQHNQLAAFDSLENTVFKEVVEKVVVPGEPLTDGFVTIAVDEGMGIITLRMSTPSQELSLLFVESFHRKLERLYYENIIFSQKLAYQALQAEVDTVQENYRRAYYQLQKCKDARERLLKTEIDPNNEEIRYLAKKIHKLEVSATIYKINYEASVKSLKSALVDMYAKAPLIMLMDKTRAPIISYQPSAKSAAISGAIMGIGLAIFLIIGWKIYKDIATEMKDMSSPEIALRKKYQNDRTKKAS